MRIYYIVFREFSQPIEPKFVKLWRLCTEYELYIDFTEISLRIFYAPQVKIFRFSVKTEKKQKTTY